jgi:hypothetical protein
MHCVQGRLRNHSTDAAIQAESGDRQQRLQQCIAPGRVAHRSNRRRGHARPCMHTRTVLYCTVLYCTVLYCAILYCTVLCYTVLYCAILYCAILYCTVLYCTVLYCTVLCYTVLYCTVHPRLMPPKLKPYYIRSGTCLVCAKAVRIRCGSCNLFFRWTRPAARYCCCCCRLTS